MARNYRLALIGAGLCASLGSGLVLAHAKLVNSDPAADVTVHAPKSIHLEFNEPIASQFSSFRLTDTDGNAVATMSMKAPDSKSIDAMPTAKLAPGLYTVTWTAVSTSDGHKTGGSFSFTVE